MRQKRAKAYKRLMTLYSQVFGFRSPFQVLVGSDFLIEASKKDLDIWKQLQTCVQSECKPMITQCSVEHLYRLGKEYQKVVDVAKTFERRRCNHREAKPEDECIADVVGPANKHRYTIALQDSKLRNQLRRIAGVPIIHFNDRGVMVLELPSPATLAHKEKEEQSRLTAQLATHQSLPNVITGTENGEATAAPLKRKKVNGPNPLSVRRKKGGETQAGPSKPAIALKPEVEAEQHHKLLSGTQDAQGDTLLPSMSAPAANQLVTPANLKRPREEAGDVDPARSTEAAVKKRRRKRPKKGGATTLEEGDGSDDE